MFPSCPLFLFSEVILSDIPSQTNILLPITVNVMITRCLLNLQLKWNYVSGNSIAEDVAKEDYLCWGGLFDDNLCHLW